MLTTVDKVKEAMAHIQTPPNLINDNLILRLIKQVGSTAEIYCHRYFLYGSYIETLDIDGVEESFVYLKGLPVITLTTLEIKYGYNTDFVEIDSDNYSVNLTLGEVYYPSIFTKGIQNTKATYVCGYSALDTILDKDLTAPPDSPSTNDYYIVKATGTGDWEGYDTQVAKYDGSVWAFTVPYRDMEVYVSDEDKVYKWSGSAWAEVVSRSDYPPPDDLEGAVIDEVVCRFNALMTEPMPVPMGGRIEDLRGKVLSDNAKAVFEMYRLRQTR